MYSDLRGVCHVLGKQRMIEWLIPGNGNQLVTIWCAIPANYMGVFNLKQTYGALQLKLKI